MAQEHKASCVFMLVGWLYSHLNLLVCIFCCHNYTHVFFLLFIFKFLWHGSCQCISPLLCRTASPDGWRSLVCACGRGEVDSGAWSRTHVASSNGVPTTQHSGSVNSDSGGRTAPRKRDVYTFCCDAKHCRFGNDGVEYTHCLDTGPLYMPALFRQNKDKALYMKQRTKEGVDHSICMKCKLLF